MYFRIVKSINPFEQNIKRNLYFVISFSIADSLKALIYSLSCMDLAFLFMFFQDSVIRSRATMLLHDKLLDIGKLFGDSLA